VPVPWDERHVFYVWYDALFNYLTPSATATTRSASRRVARVHHLIGKEILRFTVWWWPASAWAAGIDPPAHVFVHGWLLVGGQKLSRSMVAARAGGRRWPS